MQFDIVTIFPDFFSGPLNYGIVRRAREAGLVDARVHDLRDFSHDRHRTVDDRPFGGGEGMVMKPEPLFEAVESLLGVSELQAIRARSMQSVPRQSQTMLPRAEPGPGMGEDVNGNSAAIASASSTAIVLLSASGKLFRQDNARRFAHFHRIVLLCGRYEGVDERVAEHLATDELSIGDFVLSGGELAAALVLDAVTRLLPGALGNENSTVNESFSAAEAAGLALVSTKFEPSKLEPSMASRGILDFPHYTRPAEFRGWQVPEILMGGKHEQIRRWRREKAIDKTHRNRPDLLQPH